MLEEYIQQRQLQLQRKRPNPKSDPEISETTENEAVDDATSLKNNNESQSEELSESKASDEKKFDIKQEYIINSMNWYHTTLKEYNIEVIVITPIENQAKVDTSFVLGKSKMLINYFANKKPNEDIMGNSFQIEPMKSNRSMRSHKQRNDLLLSNQIRPRYKLSNLGRETNPFCIQFQNKNDLHANRRNTTSGGILFSKDNTLDDIDKGIRYLNTLDQLY